MIEICNKDKCTGCGLCTALCAQKAITLQEGKLGHLFPVIDQTKCTNCGLCKKKCPANTTAALCPPQKAYAAFSKDETEYKSSTSGGAAAELSNYIIGQGGVVYGCSICNIDSKNIDVKHIRVTTAKELQLLKGSKYVQSRIAEVLPLLKEDIRNGKKVLFIGTPCQVAAVKNLFPKAPDNLWLVDLICHGVPSLQLLQEHIKSKIGNSNITNVRFRNESSYCLIISGENNKMLYKSELKKERYKDEYYNSFFDGFTIRNSCYKCLYARGERVSDITIGDFWGLGKLEDASNIKQHTNGISLILPVTDKGMELLQMVKTRFNIYERPITEAINGNDQLREPKAMNKRIFIFRTLLNILPFKYAYRLMVADRKIRFRLKKH